MNIVSKKQLKDVILKDISANTGGKGIRRKDKFRLSYSFTVCKYLTVLRKEEYACYKRDNERSRIKRIFISQIIKVLDRKKNKLGLKAGIDIPVGKADSGIRIAHPNVILNGEVGSGCIFHGNNVLGNKKTGDRNAVPKLGKHVDVGVGAIIIGKVEIADDCVIGAGAVVTKSFLKPESVIVGNPAREISAN